MTINQADQERTEQLLIAYTFKRIKNQNLEVLHLTQGRQLYYSGNEGYVLKLKSSLMDDPLVEFRVRTAPGNAPSNWAPAKFEKAFSCCHATHRLVPQNSAIPFPFDRNQLQHPSYEQLEATVSE